MATSKFIIHVDPVGFGEVRVNGRDVTDETTGFRVESVMGQPTILTLYHSGQGALSGDAIVQAVEHHEDEAAVIKAFLSNLDPGVIEKAALERQGWGGDSTVTAEVFAILAKIADGEGL